MRHAPSIPALITLSAAALVATSTTRAHAASQISLPVPACGVAVWGVTGGDHSSYTPLRDAKWDGGPNGPMPRDAPLAPTAREQEVPANPAEGTPLVLVGGVATVAGGVWTAATLASASGDDSLDGLVGAVPLTAIGLVLVGIGVAKWAGPSPWDHESDAARSDAPLIISSRGVGAAF